MADNRFVGERYSVRYVSSGRDLLRTVPKPTDTRFAFFGSPDFRADGQAPAGNAAPSATLALRATERGDLQGLVFQPLPGTERECKLLDQRAKAGRYQTELHLGAEATEQTLAATKAPRVLHLATHGFFLPEADLGETKPQLMRFGAGFGDSDALPKGKLLNPMHRSGLALAGAQRTIEAWARGAVPPPQNDGILTAEEVAGLNLEGTWLVTLSACETGSGEARAGEGVLGLRRAFVQAGAAHLMMTLWPISDETTVEIINQFYTAAFTLGHPGKAMAGVQTAWLTKLRKEKGLLYAVNRAGPFIVTFLGPAEPETKTAATSQPAPARSKPQAPPIITAGPTSRIGTAPSPPPVPTNTHLPAASVATDNAPSKFRYNYKFDDPGYRTWTRVNDSWEEKPPSGGVKRFKSRERSVVDGRIGSVLESDDANFRVFVSDRQVAQPRIYFQRGIAGWQFLGTMEDVE